MLTFFNCRLSIRLQTVARLVPQGSTIADIGTDHAHLPLYLVSKGHCPRAIAVENTPGPYRRAEAAVNTAGFRDQIKIRFGDGLQVLKPGEVDTVIITGLGGSTQQAILAAAPSVTKKLDWLILQPQTNIGTLRRWLASVGWCLVEEELVYESNHYYFILMARQGSSPEYSNTEWQLGPLLIEGRHPLLTDYLQDKMEKLKIAIKRMAFSKKAAVRLQREKYIKQLEQLRGVFAWLQNAKK